MAVYRMEREGWSNLEAFAEMDHFGAHRIWQDLRNFVRSYKNSSISRGKMFSPPRRTMSLMRPTILT